MAVLKALTSGGKRRELDFYPTPPEATRALLPLIEHWRPRTAWEPCCGDGAISKVLLEDGWDVESTDIVDRGFGRPNMDFFGSALGGSAAIITNPPFGRADEFIRHARKLNVQRMALLLKINFYSAAKRISTWVDWTPKAIHPLTWRLDFTGAGSPHTDCMWVLWEAGRNHDTRYAPLAKPLDQLAELVG